MSNEDMVRAIDDRRLEPMDEPDPVCYCNCCGEPMYIGEQRWKINGETICEDCAKYNYMEIIKE